MIALKTILIPTDFSEPSANALKYARAFAENFKASIHLLHVLELTAFYGWEAPVIAREDLERGALNQLEHLITETEKEQSCVLPVLRTGSPFVEIVRYAREANVDLIVMGTHGRGPIAHMLMGSVAEKVVRKAPCPVLTVRHPEHEFVMP
jgi:nucleotide-binding universal stress UspA family protein